MPRIKKYQLDNDINGKDLLVGTDRYDFNKTKNYKIEDLKDYIIENISTIQSFRFIQASNSSLWIINHNLGFKPSVTVIDLDGDVVNGDITYNTNNQLTLTFAEPIKGEAYLN